MNNIIIIEKNPTINSDNLHSALAFTNKSDIIFIPNLST